MTSPDPEPDHLWFDVYQSGIGHPVEVELTDTRTGRVVTAIEPTEMQARACCVEQMSAPTLSEWLMERLAEDEQVARAAKQGRWFWADPSTESSPQGDRSLHADLGSWGVCEYFCTWSGEENLHRGEPGKPGHEHRLTEVVVSAWGHDASGLDVDDADADHIVRHDPARVLAKVAAERRIVELHVRLWSDNPAVCRTCHVRYDAAAWPCMTLRLLALPRADLPGYREQWAP